MNFKKVLSIASVASIAVVGLASCKKETTEKGVGYNGSINLSLDYKGASGLTYGRFTTSLPDTYKTVDGKTLVKGASITPIWQDIGNNLGVSFKDAAMTGETTAKSMEAAILAGYKGYQNRQIDILQITSNDTFTDATRDGGFVNLNEYKAYLPNLYKWLNTHANVKDQMTSPIDGGIYYTPYFDGVDQIEKGFNMNVEMVEALLDEEVASTNTFKNGTYDTTTDLTAVYGTSSALEGGKNVYIPSLTNQEIAVYDPENKVNGKITVTIANNIVTTQNALATKNGKTLTDALKSYIDTVYGDYIGEGKLYSKRSEIFTSSKACYNADELIALLRCVKTNPKYLTGKDNLTMVPIFPRTGESNRASIMFELSQMFGLRGTNGENSRYWINEKGELVDSMTQDYALECIEKMNALQSEGLFPESEHWYLNGNAKNDYRKQLEFGNCFMTYDYFNVSAFNQDYQGKDGWKTQKMQAVIPPVAKWPITKDGNGNAIVGAVEGAGYSYTRFSEDNRSLKDGGWAICSSVAKDEQKLYKCLEIIDYLYSEEGSFLECYGVNYKDKDGTFDIDANGNATFKNALCDEIVTDSDGVRYPKLTKTYTDEIKKVSGGTWHNYMTQYLGSCIGVGNIRSNYLEAQNVGANQALGMNKVADALSAKAMFMTTTAGSNFFKSVNTSCTYSDAQKTDNDTNAKALTDWWNISKNKDTNGWVSTMLSVIEGGWEKSSASLQTKASVKALFSKAVESRVKNTATQWGMVNKEGKVLYTGADQYTFLK